MLYTETREAVKDVTDKWWLFWVGGMAYARFRGFSDVALAFQARVAR